MADQFQVSDAQHRYERERKVSNPRMVRAGFTSITAKCPKKSCGHSGIFTRRGGTGGEIANKAGTLLKCGRCGYEGPVDWHEVVRAADAHERASH
jgi:hypothetical protein